MKKPISAQDIYKVDRSAVERQIGHEISQLAPWDSTTKNPHAVALGRLGGSKSSPAQQAARTRNAQLPRPGRHQHQLVNGELFRRAGLFTWELLEPPYDAKAKAWLRRQR